MPRSAPILLLLLLAILAGCRSLPRTETGRTPAREPDGAVTVVSATLSAPNEAERRASRRAADLIARLLADSGVTVHRWTDDDLFTRESRTRLIILAYNPVYPDIAPLVRHIQKGGRLIVFYSSDPALAALLGFRLGPLRKAPPGQDWTSYAFCVQAPLLPARVRQSSRLARPAYPANPGGIIWAWWEGSDLPAWTLSDRGAWMSHILQDGDTASRRRLLLGLAAEYDPDIIRAASRHSVRRAGAAPPYASADAMLDLIRSRGYSPAPLEAERTNLAALHGAGRHEEAILAEERLGDHLAAAVAATEPSAPREFRAVWNSTGLGLYGGSDGWARTVRRLKACGFNAVFPYAGSAGTVLYPGGRLPQTEAGKATGDPLAACVKAAREQGVAVHAWKICWNLEGSPEEQVARLKAAGRLQVNAAGETVNWLCPSRADNVEWELANLEELARRYPLQGIQLDYIRFPDRASCFCKSCRAGFEKAEKVRVARWPADAQKPPLAEKYVRFRAGQITRFVRLARSRLRALRPELRLSAAVYGWYPGCIGTLGQDWGGWLARDEVDFVCPMNYTAATTEYEGWLRNQVALPGARGRIIPGIGVTSVSSRLNGLQTIEQVRAGRRLGARGFVLYDLNHSLDHDVLPLLGLGATADQE